MSLTRSTGDAAAAAFRGADRTSARCSPSWTGNSHSFIRSDRHFNMGEPGVQTKWPSDYRTSCSTSLSCSCTGEIYDTTSKQMSSLLTLSPINKQPTARALHFYICQELRRFNGQTIRSYCCSVSALLAGRWWRFLFSFHTHFLHSSRSQSRHQHIVQWKEWLVVHSGGLHRGH